MRRYTLSLKNFIIHSDGWLATKFWYLGDRIKKKENNLDQECLEIAYKAFLKRMKKFYKAKEIEDEEKLVYLLKAVIDCKKKVIEKEK